jgi:hypothetical protein
MAPLAAGLQEYRGSNDDLAFRVRSIQPVARPGGGMTSSLHIPTQVRRFRISRSIVILQVDLVYHRLETMSMNHTFTVKSIPKKKAEQMPRSFFDR